MDFRKGRAAAASLLVASILAVYGQTPRDKVPVSRRSLCVTEGTVGSGEGHQLTVDDPKVRAYVNGWTSQAVETQFTYLGSTTVESRLESGELRHQFGLKLLAQNACNLVYVMWRFEPESRIVVSVKKNPGQTTSAECGNRGYENIKAVRSEPVPAVRPGDSHDLEARMQGTELTVSVDGKEAWEGDVGQGAADLKGPVGIRSDNARLNFNLSAGPFEGPHPQYARACQSGAEE
jgi:hypothetical protein